MTYSVQPPISLARPVRRGVAVQVTPGAVFRQSRGGYLSSSIPGALITVLGAPVSATVRVLLRRSGYGDGVLVAQTQSAQDGTWRVDGLNPALRYDVVGRLDGYNDFMVANLTPAVDP